MKVYMGVYEGVEVYVCPSVCVYEYVALFLGLLDDPELSNQFLGRASLARLRRGADPDSVLPP